MQNRGVSFSLGRGALNRLEPGRLPVHTLNPALAVLRDGGSWPMAPWGAMPSRKSRRRCSPATSVIGCRSPRPWSGRVGCWDRRGLAACSLLVESRFDAGVVAALRTAGHDVEVLGEPYADSMGHAGAVLLHQNGTLEGAHDPRADGGAAGL